jgi:hypothetical protein
MALVAYEGFDHYGNDYHDVLNRRGGGLQWNAVGSNNGFVSPGRNGSGSAYLVGYFSSLLGVLSAPLASAYIGFGLQGVNPSGDNTSSIQLSDVAGSATHLTIYIDSNAACFHVYRGNTLLGSSVNNSFTVGAWNFIEMLVAISPTSGAVLLRSNGQDVLNLSGINTQNGGSAQFDGIRFTGGVQGGIAASIAIDDFYVNDTTTGPGMFPMNYFAGDIRVVTLHAVGDYGTPGWTPLTGTNWSRISEAHADGDTSYNSTSTVAAQDRFTFEALSATISNVIAIQVTGAYRKDDAGMRVVTQLLDSGGTEVAGAGYSIPTSYVYCSDLWPIDPNTGSSWTLAAANALKAGYMLTA